MPDICVRVAFVSQQEEEAPYQIEGVVIFPGSAALGYFVFVAKDILWSDSATEVNAKILEAAISRLVIDGITVDPSDNKIIVGGAV